MKKQLFILVYFCLTSPRYLLIPDTFVGSRRTIWNPPTYLALKTMEPGVPCNYRVQEEETKCLFGLMCRGGRLWSFFGSVC